MVTASATVVVAGWHVSDLRRRYETFLTLSRNFTFINCERREDEEEKMFQLQIAFSVQYTFKTDFRL